MRDLLNLLLVEAADVDLVRSSDDVSGVDTAQGNTVDLEGTGDEQDTLVKRLEEDDTLATEATGEEDQDGAGLERLARSPGADGLADLWCKWLALVNWVRLSKIDCKSVGFRGCSGL